MKLIVAVPICFLVVGCGFGDNETQKKVNIVVRGSEEFREIASSARVSPKEAELIALRAKREAHPERERVLSGPVVAIMERKYLLASPDKRGGFRLVGKLVDLDTGVVSSVDLVDSDVYVVAEKVSPIISSEPE